jgi:hypothetical protein
MTIDDLRQRIERILDERAARHPEGAKAEDLRIEALPEVVGLLADVERNLEAEAEALLVSVGQRSRRSRRERMSRDLLYLLDAFTNSEDGAYIDPLLDLAYPIGTDDGRVKTLRHWTADDFLTSTQMAYRKAAEITASAREHDEAMTSAVMSMRARGAARFGEAGGTE